MEYQKKPTAGASLCVQDYELEAIASVFSRKWHDDEEDRFVIEKNNKHSFFIN